MGLRGIVNNLLAIYVGYKVMALWLFGPENLISPNLGWAALLIFIFGIWFFLERIGIIPKYW